MNSTTFGRGNDLIFLHGWGGDISAFLFVAKKFAGRYRVTLPDFAGFGKTPEPDHPYTVRDYAKDVLALMDSLSIRQAVLIGHSFGGRVAMELAGCYPDRVRALALVDSAGLKPRRGLKYKFKIFAHKILKKCGFRGLKGSSDYKKLTPSMKATFVNVVNYDQTPLLKDIAHPTAIFWGREDRETPPYMARRLKKGLRNSEIFWLDGGHYAYADDYNVFIAVLSAFLRTLDKDSGETALVKEKYLSDGEIV